LELSGAEGVRLNDWLGRRPCRSPYRLTACPDLTEGTRQFEARESRPDGEAETEADVAGLHPADGEPVGRKRSRTGRLTQLVPLLLLTEHPNGRGRTKPEALQR